MTGETGEVNQDLSNTIKRHAGLGVALGIGIAIAGVLSVISPFIAGLSVTVAVGILLVMSGVARLFLAFKMGSFGRGLLMFVLGALTLVAGGYLIARPGMGLATLTLVLAAYLSVDGAFEMFYAFQLRPIKGWGWTLLSGIAALVLGIMIWRQFPFSGLWAVGTIAGVHMIFAGTGTASLSSAARTAAKEETAAAA